jgi:hypothetical protein
MRKKNIVGGMGCVAIGVAITCLAVMLDPEMKNQTNLDYARLIIPGLLFVVFLIWLKNNSSVSKWAFSLLAISMPVYVLVVNWIAIFSLTNYREHHATVIYSLALIYLVFFFLMLIFERQGVGYAHNK